MSPAYGRPPSDNPKEHIFQMRLSNYDIEILEKCRSTYGLSKAATLLFGLKPLEFATNNREFRQLLDALIILKQVEELCQRTPNCENKALLERQLNQVRFNFNEFLRTYEEK